ncbi:MAG: hypothetical protein Q9211_004270, partial [Gyalolechia sp. 1 TL-2023]
MPSIDTPFAQTRPIYSPPKSPSSCASTLPPPDDFAQNRPTFPSTSSERQPEPRVRLPPSAHPSTPEEDFAQTIPMFPPACFPYAELSPYHPPPLPSIPAQHL